MTNIPQGYERILVATDFSPHAEAALKQAVWLARQSGAKIVVMHTLPDRLREVHSETMRAQLDLLYGEGETVPRELRQESDARMKQMIVDLNATDLDVRFETLPGEPFVELIHAVQEEGFDLVLAGTRGLAAWKQFLVGSTAKRLIRKCPSSVWVVKAEHVGPPKKVLAATDFSEVSRRAAREGLWIAQQASAEFHLLHSINYLIDYLTDTQKEFVTRFPVGGPLRREINDGAQKLLETFVESLDTDPAKVHLHLTWGTPWQEVNRLAQHLNIDLIALGTVGRSGLKGVLLGNTAERILDICDCSILAVKPADFVSPIGPFVRSSPSGSEEEVP